MKEWSQVVFFERGDVEIEALVEGHLDDKIVVTAVTDMDGNALSLSPEEKDIAKEALYDSIINF